MFVVLSFILGKTALHAEVSLIKFAITMVNAKVLVQEKEMESAFVIVAILEITVILVLKDIMSHTKMKIKYYAPLVIKLVRVHAPNLDLMVV